MSKNILSSPTTDIASQIAELKETISLLDKETAIENQIILGMKKLLITKENDTQGKSETEKEVERCMQKLHNLDAELVKRQKKLQQLEIEQSDLMSPIEMSIPKDSLAAPGEAVMTRWDQVEDTINEILESESKYTQDMRLVVKVKKLHDVN